MALVAARCTGCGANIQVDNEKDAGICNFCGTAFVTQKVIQNVSQTYNVEKMVVQSGVTVENLLIRARQARDGRDLIKASEIACRALDIEPLNQEAQELYEIKGKLGGKEITAKQLAEINDLFLSADPHAAHKRLGTLIGKDWTSFAVMYILDDWKKNGLPYVLEKYSEAEQLKKCYIATSAYGSYDCPEVWVLRRYRDYKLQKTRVGRLLIRCYYAVSPAIIKVFGKSKRFNSFNKKWLDKKVSKLKTKGFTDGVYRD